MSIFKTEISKLESRLKSKKYSTEQKKKMELLRDVFKLEKTCYLAYRNNVRNSEPTKASLKQLCEIEARRKELREELREFNIFI